MTFQALALLSNVNSTVARNRLYSNHGGGRAGQVECVDLYCELWCLFNWLIDLFET
jgi:hypothetical protein